MVVLLSHMMRPVWSRTPPTPRHSTRAASARWEPSSAVPGKAWAENTENTRMRPY
jgi:hypothetical protein